MSDEKDMMTEAAPEEKPKSRKKKEETKPEEQPIGAAIDSSSVPAPKETVPASEIPADQLLPGVFSDDLLSDKTDKQEDDIDLFSIISGIPLGGDYRERNKILRENISPEEFRDQLQDKTSFAQKWVTTEQYGAGNGTHSIQINSILGASKDQLEIQKLPQKAGVSRGISGKNVKESRVLSGRDALLASYARLSGIVQTPLKNSGFSMVMRYPTLGELDNFNSNVKFDADSIGRSIGGYFIPCVNAFIISKFFDMVELLTVSSDLENWEQPGVLRKNISFLDYDVIAAALLLLVYRKGIHVPVLCPKCKTITEIELDPATLVYDNKSIITDEMIDFMTPNRDHKVKHLADVRKYRRDIIERTGCDTLVIQTDEYKVGFKLQAPVLDRMFTESDVIVNYFNKSLSGEKEERQRQIDQIMALKGLQLITPWIEKLIFYDDDGVKEFMIVEDREAIRATIEQLTKYTDQILTGIEQLVNKSKVTYVGVIGLECQTPGCGVKPTSTAPNFFPLDAISLFFAQSFRQSSAEEF